ncbi:hypothetical protein IscW_ISCW002153 [Ixodes scapularis]|uniref:Nose resistant-to-fluoxetine protein N-terminal domain-containing protein n=1 Tax=Ixodes scapularis TaxID=6945 RepID=B7P8J2_IXOSC|nr:hypothetical protein IscW_ISCW002153 [Ixodes scapularis]|eukprot:XP_002402150.1 hypothetical protein IscW_ISCW002153 [Ixodes scapularis]
MWTPVKVLRLLAVVLVGTNLPVVLGNATETTEDSIMPTEDPEIVEMEEGFRRLTEDVTRFAAKQFLPIVSEIIYDPRLSGECAGGLLKIGTALRDGEGWVLMMLDSMGRPPPGMLTGRLAEYGAYEQCLDIRHPRNQFQGKYCMIQVNGNGKITPTLYKMADKFLEHLNFKRVQNDIFFSVQMNSFMAVVSFFAITALIETGMYVYNKAFAHAPALFTGIIFGCLAAKPHQLSRKAQAFWWTVATVSACTSLFGIYSWNRGRAPEHLETVIYAAMHRLTWAFAVSWVMYACATGRGGPVNKILANPLLYPLGRLSFAVYIVHAIVLGVNAILSRERKSHQPFLQAQDYISATITSYAFATISYLCIECPIAVLDNLVFGGVKPKKDLSVEAPKQNGTHELKSVHIANGVASKGALSKPINGIPTSVTSDGDSLHNEEYKNQHSAHENAAYEKEFGVKIITNNNDSTVTVQF